jgi:hypothetical protein
MRYLLLPLLFVSVLAGAVITPLASRPHDAGETTSYSMVPHVVDGGFWKTTFKFVNLETHAVDFSIVFLEDDGSSMILPLLANADEPAGDSPGFHLTLNPAESITVETAGTASSLTSGWAVVIQDNSNDQIGKFAIFRQHVPDGQDQEATVPISDPSAGNFAMLFDNTAYVTGIAIVNPNSIVIPVDVYIRNQQGAIIDKQSLVIPAVNHVAFPLQDLWPSTKGIEGALEFVTSGYALGALGLRFSGAAFTTFDVFQNPKWGIQ